MPNDGHFDCATVPANTPVLVGVAAVQQRFEHCEEGLEPVQLMVEALQRAAADAGAPDLLGRVDEILVPQGIWAYSDPARLIARAFAAGRTKAGAVRTLLAEIDDVVKALRL